MGETETHYGSGMSLDGEDLGLNTTAVTTSYLPLAKSLLVRGDVICFAEML